MNKQFAMTLRDFNNTITPVTSVWIAGVGCPAGQSFRHDLESDGDDYCDVNEVIEDLHLWDLEGTVCEGQWSWNGSGSPTDVRGNSIYNLKAR